MKNFVVFLAFGMLVAASARSTSILTGLLPITNITSINLASLIESKLDMVRKSTDLFSALVKV